jgi:protease-4
VRALTLLLLGCLLAAGCGHLPPLKVGAEVGMTLRNPVEGKMEATLNTLPDPGPLQEVSLTPGGPCPAENKIAVIDVDGLLLNNNPVGPYSAGENPLAIFQEKLKAAATDPAVKAVVLRINSPGGSVAATDQMWRSLVEFRSHSNKPVVACLLDLGTGGGYYLASGCDQVVAIPSSVVGGIGVMLNLYYLEIAMEQMNVFAVSVKSGERIDMGTPTRKMTAEEKAMLTSMANEYHAQFRQVVLRGRPRINPNSMVFDGRVMTASKALAEGLVDQVGYLQDAVIRAISLARVEDAAVVMYCRRNNPAHTLFDSVSNKPIHSTLLPWSTPGLDRSRLPLFLYLWNVEPTMLRLSGQ